MNYVCVIDSSLPPYAAPLARECVATALVPREAPAYRADPVTALLCVLGLLAAFLIGRRA